MSHRHPKRRRHKIFRRNTAINTAPGTICVDPNAPRSVVTVIGYGANQFEEKKIDQLGQLDAFCKSHPVVWINVEGLGDEAILKGLADRFHLHRLAIEDVVHVHQRAKIEQFEEQLFIVARMATLHERLETEQVSLFLGCNYVITFQEGGEGDSFEPVRQRLREGRGKLRGSGADYLAYSLLDATIDAYFPVIEAYGEQVDNLEDEVLSQASRQSLPTIHALKTDLLTLRRTIWPLREALSALMRDPTPLITDETRLHLRDCYDHTVQLIDLLEMYRELGSDLRDLYLSSISNRMNEIMKVLTVISTIFIPLNFIAGVYGMNFKTEASPWNMPELSWYFGYPFAISVMVLLTATMLWFFRRRGWIGRGKWQ